MLSKLRSQWINNCLLAAVFLCIFFVSLSQQATDFKWFPSLAAVSLILLADMILFSYLKTKDILSFRIIFFILSFLFHMGYSWIYLFHPDFSFAGMDFSQAFNPEVVFSSYITSLGLIIVIYLGVQLGDSTKPPESRSLFRQLISHVNINRRWTNVSYRNIGIAALVISLPLRIYTDLTRIRLGQMYDYLATFDFQLNGYLSMLADVYIIGVVLLMIYYRKRKVLPALLLIGTSAYLLFSMNSGSRGMAMINIVILFFVYNLCVYKFKKGALALLVIVSVIIGSYLTTIGLTRVSNTPNINGDRDIAARFLQEFGGTQLTMILVMNKVDSPGAHSYALGGTYAASLVTVFPNVSTAMETYVKSNDFQLQLNYPTVGGSYLAELYYNFGQLSYMLAFIVGYLLSRFERLMISLEKEKKYILFALTVLIARQALWWIRDSSLVFPRYIVEGIVVMILLVFILQIFRIARVEDQGKRVVAV